MDTDKMEIVILVAMAIQIFIAGMMTAMVLIRCGLIVL